MGNNIILYGASGHCKVIIDILQCNNQAIEGLIDDNPKFDTIFGFKVLNSNSFDFSSNKNVILSIGNNKIRKKLAVILSVNFVTAIHPKAIISRDVNLGVGTVVMAGVIINPDATIGNHCIINTGAVVEHDCEISDYVHVSPNASLAGNVFVGEGSQVGIGASVIQGIKIGKWVTIGAGAVIIKDVPDFAVVVGNPGRIIKVNNNE
ncbi:acetyltransferase [Flavobacterium psychrophilum]|uniref:R3-group acyltransferase n=1 Tax=Flavobacterium psychrophilum TaxID=96345 RepID=A0A4P8PJC1_FLAPS|nr:acetyltransferase [Flavobacterium psychrophilum]MCB5971342.1 acetyltransferase [Flavobacterium psychrophilum]MCB5977482.1 acetyltransferase [Flavobacterium psychrophilum]MCB6063303.1 acetyltransferase [Flavobacterium psychrophilum]MCB6065240.1 acetyltransferase [Flavobacterium psychrophilum]MCB6229953.1 acetyltransferase [Flavobacterium psychrophilum]